MAEKWCSSGQALAPRPVGLPAGGRNRFIPTTVGEKKRAPLDSCQVRIKLYLERCFAFENSVRQVLRNVRRSLV
jgi:hypothetical protein